MPASCPTVDTGLTWTSYTPDGAGFEVSFPGDAEPSRNTHSQVIDDMPATVETATIAHPPCSFVVAWSELPTEPEPGLGQREAAWAAEGLSGTVVSEGEALVAGLPGYEFIVTADAAATGLGIGLWVREQYLVVGRRVYLVQAIAADPPGVNPLADEFFATFAVQP